MKLYSKYIYKKILVSFISLAALLISLIWFSRTITFVKYITENGVEIYQVFSLFLLILPWLLLFIIPISLFVAILLVYNRLIINNEITILKNSGLTKAAIGRPVRSIAVLVMLFCYFISIFLMPYANKKLRLAKLEFENNYSNLSFEKGTFEALKKMTIYVKEKDEKNELYGILLNDQREKGYSITITAKKGRVIFDNAKLLLYMEEGTIQRYNTVNLKSEILNFDEYIFNLSESSSSTIATSERWKPKERYIHELLNPNKADAADAKEVRKYRGELQQRITYPLMSIVLAAIALASMLRGNFSRYGNGMNIAIACAMAISFLIITITCYRLIEKNYYFIILLYINFGAFLGVSMSMLKYNYRFKK